MSAGEAARERRPVPKNVYYGEDEKIFEVLPEGVLLNFSQPKSENSVLWNLVYPISQPTISMKSVLEISPLWGTMRESGIKDDELTPYFWGFDVGGMRLKILDDVLEQMDGPGPRTEVDLFLVGDHAVVSAEVKNTSSPGRCSRYSQRRCPEIHPGNGRLQGCRYWETGRSGFSELLEFGPRPGPDDELPPCDRHYQLARTMLVGNTLAGKMQKEFHLWMVVPRRRWRSVEPTWLDFADRVRDPDLWRRMRVIPWEGFLSIKVR